MKKIKRHLLIIHKHGMMYMKKKKKEKKRVLIVFDNMVPDMKANKKLIPIFTEFFMRSRKLNILLVFIS